MIKFHRVILIKIYVTAMATLKKFLPTKVTFEFDKKITIAQFLSFYQISPRMIMLIKVNNEIVNQDYILKDNDKLLLYPYISGG